MPNNKEFVSSKSCEMQFFLSEFSESKQIDWTFNIVPENSILSYDFIIGRDDFLMICYLFLDCHLLVDWLRLWQSAIYYHSAHGEGPIRDTKIKDLLFGNSHRKKANGMYCDWTQLIFLNLIFNFQTGLLDRFQCFLK